MRVALYQLHNSKQITLKPEDVRIFSVPCKRSVRVCDVKCTFAGLPEHDVFLNEHNIKNFIAYAETDEEACDIVYNQIQDRVNLFRDLSLYTEEFVAWARKEKKQVLLSIKMYDGQWLCHLHTLEGKKYLGTGTSPKEAFLSVSKEMMSL